MSYQPVSHFATQALGQCQELAFEAAKQFTSSETAGKVQRVFTETAPMSAVVGASSLALGAFLAGKAICGSKLSAANRTMLFAAATLSFAVSALEAHHNLVNVELIQPII